MSVFVFSPSIVSRLCRRKRLLISRFRLCLLSKHKVSKKSCHQSVSVYTSSLLHFTFLFAILWLFFIPKTPKKWHLWGASLQIESAIIRNKPTKKKNPPSLIKRESAAIKVWLIMYKCLFANLRPLLTKQGLNHHNSVWVRFGEVWESWKVKWQTVKWWKKRHPVGFIIKIFVLKISRESSFFFSPSWRFCILRIY